MKKDLHKVIKQIVSEIRLSPGSRGTQFSDKFIEAHNKIKDYITGWYEINYIMGNVNDMDELDPDDIELMVFDADIMKAAFYAYRYTGIEDITSETDITDFIKLLDDYLEIGEDEVKAKLMDLGWLS
jgi:hypothetical protein